MGQWATIIPGIIVSCGTLLVVWLVRTGVRSIKETVATKEFVTDSLKVHGDALMGRIGEMFVRTSNQNQVNADVENRLRNTEAALALKTASIPPR